jgi:hypothetical protein
MKKDSFFDAVLKILFDEDGWKIVKKDDNGKPLTMESPSGDMLKYIYEDGKLVGFEGTRHTEEED